ncbi:MAG: hypothetical protein JWP81_4342 [Ferruginibacter sp.]|nr:hypothetical protein [Ferruginibacter sp.]
MFKGIKIFTAAYLTNADFNILFEIEVDIVVTR